MAFTPQLSGPEALTVAAVGKFLELILALSDRTPLARHWANLWVVKQLVWQEQVWLCGADRDYVQVMGTLPVPIYGLCCYRRWYIFQGNLLLEPRTGYCASKSQYFFGFKVDCALYPTG